jgi:23S rRNA (guanosine2251-2'-O)-methyltransferase
MRKLKMSELNRKTKDEFKSSGKTAIVVVLDNVRSLMNVGSIFRTADAFLLEGIYLCGLTGCPPDKEIHKTALGATETVHWEHFENTLTAIQKLKEMGYRVFGIEQVEGAVQLDEFVCGPKDKIAVVFGHEVKGVSPEVLLQCEAAIEIPQWGMKHSLNIAVAAGIVIWELSGKLSLTSSES